MVYKDFFLFSLKPHLLQNSTILPIENCYWTWMAFKDLSVNQIQRSSANRARPVFDRINLSMSLKYILNNVWDSELPWGTEVRMFLVSDDLPFQVTWKFLPVRKFSIHLIKCGLRRCFSSLLIIPICEALSKAFSSTTIALISQRIC